MLRLDYVGCSRGGGEVGGGKHRCGCEGYAKKERKFWGMKGSLMSSSGRFLRWQARVVCEMVCWLVIVCVEVTQEGSFDCELSCIRGCRGVSASRDGATEEDGVVVTVHVVR